MFIALRRLSKKVWLLQYDDDGHRVNCQGFRTDYTRRIEQFLGYYLKQEIAPKWMTIGVTTVRKETFSGFDDAGVNYKPRKLYCSFD